MEVTVKPMAKCYSKHGSYTGYIEVDCQGRKLLVVRSHNGYQWGREVPPSWMVYAYAGETKTAGTPLRVCATRREAIGYATNKLTND